MSTQPVNKNFLQGVKWQFAFAKLPEVSFFIQNINLPSLSFGRRDVPTPFVKLPYAGDHLDYGEVNITFKVDEDMTNYLSIHNWMVGLGFPDSFKQYADLVAASPNGKVYSDATLTIQTNAKNPNIRVLFSEMFPVFLSDLNFDTNNSGELDCVATFAYQKYTITRIQE